MDASQFIVEIHSLTSRPSLRRWWRAKLDEWVTCPRRHSTTHYFPDGEGVLPIPPERGQPLDEVEVVALLAAIHDAEVIGSQRIGKYELDNFRRVTVSKSHYEDDAGVHEVVDTCVKVEPAEFNARLPASPYSVLVHDRVPLLIKGWDCYVPVLCYLLNRVSRAMQRDGLQLPSLVIPQAGFSETGLLQQMDPVDWPDLEAADMWERVVEEEKAALDRELESISAFTGDDEDEQEASTDGPAA